MGAFVRSCMNIHSVYSLISEIKTDRFFQNSTLLCRNSEEVEGLFLILAETDGTALIKPIVCSELLLPKPSVPLIVELSNETTQLVGKLINSQVLLLIAVSDRKIDFIAENARRTG